MAISKNLKWVKPLKKSQKVKLRKELEKRKKEKKNPKLKGDRWEYKI